MNEPAAACSPQSPKPPTGARRMRELLARPGIIRSLGAHDVFTALIIEQAGLAPRPVVPLAAPATQEAEHG